MEKDIAWQAREHTHTEKSADWFWVLGIVAFAVAVTSVLFGNLLFAVLVVVGASVLGLLANKEPALVDIGLTTKGVVVGPDFYPYEFIEAFWIEPESHDGTPILLLDPRGWIAPHMVLPLTGTDIEAVRTYIQTYLPEKKLKEPFGQALFELFGY